MKSYLIKKGHHYSSGFHFGLNLRNNVSRTINFSDSCKYTLPAKNTSDINKVYGFSNGYHMKNSARIGWRYNKEKDMIDLLCYMHIDGVIVMEWVQDIYLMSVPVNVDIKTYIKIDDDKYWFMASYNGTTVVKNFAIGKKAWKFGYRLFPYFGGSCVATDNMRILIK